MARAAAEVRFRSGCRHAESARLIFEEDGGAQTTIELETEMQFYMAGIGYLGSEWGHGQYKGKLAVGYDRYVLSEVDEADLAFLHVQALCRGVVDDLGRALAQLVQPPGQSLQVLLVEFRELRQGTAAGERRRYVKEAHGRGDSQANSVRSESWTAVSPSCWSMSGIG